MKIFGISGTDGYSMWNFDCNNTAKGYVC